MINQVYRLTAPRRIETHYLEEAISSDKIIVRPTYLSICHADQRYFTGNRSAEALAKKLPMAMIHEGIGKVVYDPTNQFEVGEDVVMVPNTPTETDSLIKENYLRSSKFRSSGYDGFMQDYVFMDLDRLVKIPKHVNPEVAAYTELVSVAVHALNRFEETAHERRERFGIWGDGNLGFITSLLIKKLYPDSKVYVFGKTQSKLDYFSFADETYHIDQIPESISFDHAFECVGGVGSQYAINQIIDHISPEGTIGILGVSEEPVPLNTRMVLEKGLKVVGSSRSGVNDFQQTIDLLAKHEEISGYLANLVSNVYEINQIDDIYEAFEEDYGNAFGKTVLKWNL